MPANTIPPSHALRQRWLAALLPLVPTEGWTEVAAIKAAEIAVLSPDEQALAAPGGVRDLLEAFFDGAETTARAHLETSLPTDLPVHKKVAAGVKAWLGALEPHQGAVKAAAQRGLLPWSAGAAASRTWAVADMIWQSAGDTATDYNRYSKRGLLASVLPGLVFF